MSESAQKALRIIDIRKHGEEKKALEDENARLRQLLFETQAKLAEFQLEEASV
jgi:hypothetical protein